MNSLTKTTYVDGTVFNSVRSSSSEITFDSIDESQWLVDFLLFDADMSRETEALAGSIDDYSRDVSGQNERLLIHGGSVTSQAVLLSPADQRCLPLSPSSYVDSSSRSSSAPSHSSADQTVNLYEHKTPSKRSLQMHRGAVFKSAAPSRAPSKATRKKAASSTRNIKTSRRCRQLLMDVSESHHAQQRVAADQEQEDDDDETEVGGFRNIKFSDLFLRKSVREQDHLQQQCRTYEVCGERNNFMLVLHHMNDLMLANWETFNLPREKPSFSHIVYNADNLTQFNHLKFALTYRFGLFAEVVCLLLLIPVMEMCKRLRWVESVLLELNCKGEMRWVLKSFVAKGVDGRTYALLVRVSDDYHLRGAAFIRPPPGSVHSSVSCLKRVPCEIISSSRKGSPTRSDYKVASLPAELEFRGMDYECLAEFDAMYDSSMSWFADERFPQAITRDEAFEVVEAMAITATSRLAIFGAQDLMRLAVFAARISDHTVVGVVNEQTAADLQRGLERCPFVTDKSITMQLNYFMRKLMASTTESSVGIVGATNSLQVSRPDLARLHYPQLVSAMCAVLQSLFPHSTVCTLDDKHNDRLLRRNPFHFEYDRGGNLDAIMDRMSRKISSFSLLMMDYVSWDGSESTVSLVSNFLECLMTLEARNMFTHHSVAIVPNVDGIADCFGRYNLQHTHDIQCVSKEDCLLYQVAEQFESIHADQITQTRYNRAHLARFGAVQGHEFLVIRLKRRVTPARRSADIACVFSSGRDGGGVSSSSSSSSSGLVGGDRHSSRDHASSSSSSLSNCSSSSSSSSSAVTMGGFSSNGFESLFGGESDMEDCEEEEEEEEADPVWDLHDMSMSSSSSSSFSCSSPFFSLSP